MRAFAVAFLAFGCIGLSWLSESDSLFGSNLRARRLEGDEDGGRSGFFAAIWALVTGGETNWKEGDDHNISELGAYVFQMTIDDALPGQTGIAQSSVHMEKISKNGLTGDKWNKYAWSSGLDNDENLWIGTFNANRDERAARAMQISILRAPWGMKRKALVEGFLRYFHGQPIFESAGGQVVRRNPKTGEFDVMFQADEQHVGFRSMATRNGDIYVGSANGPDEPSDMRRYDFSWYVEGEGVGAKVFTNAGGDGQFHMLDDQGHLDSTDKSIRKMCVSGYSNRLFVGTETHECAKVLIHDPSQNSWKKIQQTGDDCKLAVSECLDLGNGKMLIGTWQTLGHALYVVDELNDDKITKVNTPNLWWHLSHGVMELNVFNDHLYVGLLSFPRGFALIRTANLNALEVQSDEWEVVTPNGFAQEQRDQLGSRVAGNEYPWSSAIVNGVYIIGTMTVSQRGISTKSAEFLGVQPQLWGSRDGTDWKLIHHEDQPSFLFGYRTMQATSDHTLYIGSASQLFETVDRETALDTVSDP